ncbi:MAG: DUF2007 domain-containing protein [Lysobacteraceae bacterium]|nr:MAG: DUF2007 domain-containing protein [Xanthomonadaceae bacterium]
MRSIYEAVHIADAYLIRQLLEQEGIPAHVAGEYLQGVVGEIPADTRVRVMVADEDSGRAREIIREWERGEVVDETTLNALAEDAGAPPQEAASARAPQQGGWGWLAMLFAGVAIGVGVTWAGLRGPTLEHGVDYDGDGGIDERLFYSGDRLLRVETDRNRDRKIDQVFHYDEYGSPERGVCDDDFDGRMESREQYAHGQLASKRVDRDGDGHAEYRSEFLLGVVFREEWFDREDRVLKRVEYRQGIPAQGAYDRDGDGRLDTARRYDARGEIVGETPLEPRA